MNELGILRHLAIKGLPADAVHLAGKIWGDEDRVVSALVEIGSGLVYAGSAECGIALMTAALQKFPEQSSVLYALGTAHAFMKRYREAAELLQRAARGQTATGPVQINLGHVLTRLEQYDEAERCYVAVLDRQPGNEHAAVGYAQLLGRKLQFCSAVSCLRSALLHNPGSSRISFCLANSLLACGQSERALIYYRLALEISPGSSDIHDNMLYAALVAPSLMPEQVDEELAWATACPLLAPRVTKAALPLVTLDADQVSTFHRRAGSLLASSGRVEPPRTEQLMNRRIRVGYLSPDIHSHPVGFFLESVLLHHDKSSFELFVFCPMLIVNELTQRLQAEVEHWIELPADDRDRAAALLASAGLDILFEMSGHTAGNYLDILATRKAPIQITWGGYPSTTGVAAIDYILADMDTLPEADEQFYTEKPLRMPEPYGYVSIMPPDDAPEPGGLSFLGLRHLTFGCFNGIYKVNERLLDVWSEILAAVPSSRLLLKSRNFGADEIQEDIWKRFSRRGISPERILMEGYEPRLELMRAYQRVAIALDPFPYQGGVTILEAAWMGVPTVVKRGERPPFIRHGESHLIRLGLADWIADTTDAYIAKAVDMAGRHGQLAALRGTLRNRMRCSPICDGRGFTRALERQILELVVGT